MGFLFSFKLEGAKKKVRKQRKEMIGIDASGQKTREFDQIEDRLLSFLRQRQGEHDGEHQLQQQQPAYASSSTASAASDADSSLLASLRSHPFGSGLLHLRADAPPPDEGTTTPAEEEEEEDARARGDGDGDGDGLHHRPPLPPSPSSSSSTASERLDPTAVEAQMQVHARSLWSHHQQQQPTTRLDAEVVRYDTGAFGGPSPSPTPLQPLSSIPSLGSSLSPSSSLLSSSPALASTSPLAAASVSPHVSGQRRTAPEKEQRKRRGSKRQHRQQQAEIDVDAGPDYTPIWEAQQLAHHATTSSATQSLFGHALLPPLATASLSSSAAGLDSAPTQNTERTTATTQSSPLYPLARAADGRDLAPQPSIPSTLQQWPHRSTAADGYASQQQPQRFNRQQLPTEVAQRPMHIASYQSSFADTDRFFEPSSVPLSVAGAAPVQAAAADLTLPWLLPSQAHLTAPDTFPNERSLAPQPYAQHQQHASERRRRLNEEERSLLAEGQKRVVLALCELESSNEAGRQSKRRMEEVDLASNLRYKLQRLDALSGRSVPIWTEDAHLSHFSAMSDCIRLYVVHSWPSCPLHPLALSEGNLQRFLCSRSGDEERGTSLALNIYVALALGAILLGDKLRAFTYYKEARQQLAYVFDSSDYSVAEALFGLTYIAFSKGSMKKALYYTTLAMQICRQLNAIHSSVYNRCLMSLFFVPTTTVTEKKRLWNEYTEKIATLPYYDEDRLQMFDVGDEGEDRQNAGLSLGIPLHVSAVPPRHQQLINMGPNKVSTTASMRNNVKQAKVIDRIARNSMAIFLTFHALDQKCEEKKRQLHITHQDMFIQDLFPESEELKNIYDVLNVLVGKCRLVEQMLITGTEITIVALYGELNRRLGRSTDAINWAKRCLNLLTKHEVQYLPIGILSSLIMVINIFFSYSKHSHVLQLLQALGPLARAFPSVQFLQKSYIDRLKAVWTPEGTDNLVSGKETGQTRSASPDADPKSLELPYPHPPRSSSFSNSSSSESDGDESAHTNSSSSIDGSPTIENARRHRHLQEQQRRFAQQHQQHNATPASAQHAARRRRPEVATESTYHAPHSAATTTADMWDNRQRQQEHPHPSRNVPLAAHRNSSSHYPPAASHHTAPSTQPQPSARHSPPDHGRRPDQPPGMLLPVPRRGGGSDFIAKLRRWVRDDDAHPNRESVEDLVDDFAAFLEEVDVSPSSSSSSATMSHSTL